VFVHVSAVEASGWKPPERQSAGFLEIEQGKNGKISAVQLKAV
jgi:cold shock CspA family protein